MPITRKLLAQDSCEEHQILKMDSSKRFIVNTGKEWQFLFSPNSSFSSSNQIIKIACEFNKETFDGIRLAAYLYKQNTGEVSSSSTCQFNIYRVDSPNWKDTFILSVNGTFTSETYWFKELLQSDIPSIDLFGGDTIMVEVVVTRLSETYRDRIYVNHLGIYDNITRARKDIDFLSITKKDL